jgi:hypothetical protein
VDDCFVYAPDLIVARWWPYKPVSTVTAATVFHIVSNGTNETTTSISYNTLPNGKRHQDLNAGGTTQTTISYATAANESITRVL